MWWYIVSLILFIIGISILAWSQTKTIYHGGCLSCESQEKYGKWRCLGCQYHKANWNLPNLSTFKEEIPNKNWDLLKSPLITLKKDEIPDDDGFVLFHGGCLNCKSQEFYGLNRCEGCMFREPNWSLPELTVLLPEPLFNQEGLLIYHGGCLNCKSQKEHGIKRCMGCKYQKPDWSLPDLSRK